MFVIALPIAGASTASSLPPKYGVDFTYAARYLLVAFGPFHGKINS
jgi:hypothetical protein